LLALGIQADIILFHFYDFGFWGINPGLNQEEDLLYIRYMAARLSAFRNVWWCLANEYDLLLTPLSEGTHQVDSVSTRKNWDALGRQLAAADPYHHLRSIHNFTVGHVPDYDWLTHIGFQNGHTYEMVLEMKRRYGKPAIADEHGYEGNIPGNEWGDRTPEQELEMHVRAVMAGGYACHGESYIVDGNNRDIFWAYGGEMVGQSAPKLQFFKKIIETCPFNELEPDIPMMHGSGGLCLRKGVEVFLLFFRRPDPQPGFPFLTTDMAAEYDLTLYNLWDCTATALGTIKKGRQSLALGEWSLLLLRAARGTQ
jgi:hypothetical protein